MEARIKLKEVRVETHDARSFIFEKPAGLEYTAGQYGKWFLEHENPDERGIDRCISISSSPTEENLMLTTKFTDPSSSFKKDLLELNPGQEILFRGPTGVFTLPENKDQPVVFLGGGVGITPFRSMVKFATDTALPTPITLFFANKTPDDIIFYPEFKGWAAQNPNFKAIYTVDSPDSGWLGEVGYLTGEMIKKYLTDLPQYTYYICGPPGMIDVYSKILSELGISPEQTRLEKFTGY